VHDLDRILDRQDMDRIGAVEHVDQRGERGGLAVAARSGDHDQALVVLGDLGDRRRQPEIASVGGRVTASRNAP